MADLLYTDAKVTLDVVAKRIMNNVQRLTQAHHALTGAAGDLASIATDYASFVAALNAQATANPTNVAWAGAKAQLDAMVSDYGEQKAYADTLLAAFEAVTKP